MEVVNVHVAKTQLSKLLARVEAGEEIVIARNGRPVARLLPAEGAPPRRRFGAFRGVVTVGPEFFAPLPAEELDRWEGG